MLPVAGALASDRVGPIARWTPAAEILLLQLLNGAPALAGGLRRTAVKKLYLGNLPFAATEDQVAALFSELGIQPDQISLLRDRITDQPRGFGFVEIGNDADAAKAIEGLNGKDFLGRALVVNEARPQQDGGGRGGRGGGGGRSGGGNRGGRGGGYGGGRDR
jgi:cold-inducible RNA-binding protein